MAVLEDLSANSKQKLDWKHSIVDLMKLVGMDSSLAERKALATELGYTGNQSDTATMNILAARASHEEDVGERRQGSREHARLTDSEVCRA